MAAFHEGKVNLKLCTGYTMHDGLTCVLSQGISPSLSRLRMILSTFSPSSSPRLRATANCPSCAMLLPTVGSSSYYDFQQIITALSLFTNKPRLHKPLWPTYGEVRGTRLIFNRPFPNYLWPLFQSESWCSSFQMKISFDSHANEN